VEQVKLSRFPTNRIDYDGATGKMTFVFMPTGIQTLAAESDPFIDTVIQPES
jgi:hypothetical protein